MLRGECELNEIAIEHGIAPNQLRNWKAEFLENAEQVFERKGDQQIKDELVANKRRQISWQSGSTLYRSIFSKKH